jgi:hypothetical protein
MASTLTKVLVPITFATKERAALIEDELRELPRRHQIEWDERYVWD